MANRPFKHHYIGEILERNGEYDYSHFYLFTVVVDQKDLLDSSEDITADRIATARVEEMAKTWYDDDDVYEEGSEYMHNGGEVATSSGGWKYISPTTFKDLKFNRVFPDFSHVE